MSNSLRPHGLQHARPSCPSPAPIVYSNSCPLTWWCHLTISSSVTSFSSCPQSFPASGSSPVSRLFTSCGYSIGASASVLPMNIEGWFPLGLTDLISLLSKGLSRVFSQHYSSTASILWFTWSLNPIPPLRPLPLPSGSLPRFPERVGSLFPLNLHSILILLWRW